MSKKIPATLTSVWDNGSYTIQTNCKVDTTARKISDVSTIKADYVTNIDSMFVTIKNKNYPVKNTNPDNMTY